MNWRDDLSAGECFERHCINALGMEGFHARKADVLDHDLEFENGGKTWRVECKYDRRAKQSGNLYIETEYKGRPSGIAATKAEMWMHGVGMRHIFLFDRAELHDFLLTASIESGRPGGDGNKSRGFILSIEDARTIPKTKEFWG